MQRLSIIFLGFILIIGIMFLFSKTYTSEKTTDPQTKPPVIVNNSPIGTNKLVFRGKIVKEKIPVELELGETWYWYYFDEPFLLEDNASGQPQRVDKLEVYLPKDTTTASKVESLLNRHVLATGELTWGYAESSVIQLISIEEIK